MQPARNGERVREGAGQARLREVEDSPQRRSAVVHDGERDGHGRAYREARLAAGVVAFAAAMWS